jgi:hypothetical protein
VYTVSADLLIAHQGTSMNGSDVTCTLTLGTHSDVLEQVIPVGGSAVYNLSVSGDLPADTSTAVTCVLASSGSSDPASVVHSNLTVQQVSAVN